MALFWNPKKWGHCLATYQTAVVEVTLPKACWWRSVSNGKHDTPLETEVKTVPHSWLGCTSHKANHASGASELAVPLSSWLQLPYHQSSSPFHKYQQNTFVVPPRHLCHWWVWMTLGESDPPIPIFPFLFIPQLEGEQNVLTLALSWWFGYHGPHDCRWPRELWKEKHNGLFTLCLCERATFGGWLHFNFQIGDGLLPRFRRQKGDDH